MAKGARSNTTKANNRRKAAGVFSEVALARDERLSAKLLELAKQPKPETSDVNMDANTIEMDDEEGSHNPADHAAMEVDQQSSKSRVGKKRVDKRKQKKSSIAFTKYSDRLAAKKKKGSR